MKRLIISLLATLVTISASAQFRIGGNFLLNFTNEKTLYSSGDKKVKDLNYEISLYPKFYWNLNEKMNVGSRVGFSFGRVTTGYTQIQEEQDLLQYLYEVLGYTYPEEQKITKISNTAISWSLNPFFAYKVLTWKIVSVWAEANVYFGQVFNTGTTQASVFEWDKQLQYGVQILPVVEIDITGNLAIQFHLGFPSLMWYGETSHFADRLETYNTWTFRKGGLEGLIQGFANYGLGLVRKF
ncbi:MAG: hypothetical protein MJY42_05250 [Bacteroidales bacterium]|nr:hypothetical protein [Bacteroidales bacterium]